MEVAFWDASALVPLCVKRQATETILDLSANYGMAVWWCSPVEMRSAFARLARVGQLKPVEHVQALVRLDRLRDGWREVQPADSLREKAESFVDRFPLKAADALQLAAAVSWCQGRPRNRAFISGDSQLLEAARQLGFNAIEA